MASVEAEASRDERSSAGGVVYDGFISYSHAADDLLAPRLQSGLQRFAKPWWKRRALRIFRDESSLSANPHLWSSITDALDQSGWFVLLLSPEAAESPWVNNEVEYWLEHKDADKIIPVLTDGDFTWTEGDIVSDAAPPALQGAFSDEPRWVDLRFARTEEQLDLKNPDFSAAIADVASAMHGVPKDELASEEVRQHRRTTRTAWAAGILVAVLGVAAVVFGIQAGQNADLAEANAAEAQANADDANAQRELAEDSATEAQANAQLARSRELAATALTTLDADPELATLLALESMRVAGSDPPGFLVDTVWQAAQANHLNAVLRPGDGGFASIDLSPDGTMFVAVDSDGAVGMFEAPSGQPIWSKQLETADVPMKPVFHPDGSMVTVSIADNDSAAWGEPRENDDLPNRVVFLDADDGTELFVLEYPDCLSAGSWGWSPDGSVFTISSGWDICAREGTSGMWLELLDGSTFEPIRVVDAPSSSGFGPINVEFTDTGDLYAFFFPGTDVFVAEGPDYLVTRTLTGVDGIGGVSPDGSSVATFSTERAALMALFDSATASQINVLEVDTFASLSDPVAFSADGTLVAITTEGRDTVVYDVARGTMHLRLPGGAAGTPAFSPDGRWLYTAHADGTVRIWDLQPQTLGQTVVDQLAPGDHVNAGFVVGLELGAAVVLDSSSGEFESRVVLFDGDDGTIVSELPGTYLPQALADGRFAYKRDARILVYDPSTGSEVEIAGCASADEVVCDGSGEPVAEIGPVASLDGSELMISNETGEWSIVSPDDGSLVESGAFSLPGGRPIGFTNEWILSQLNNETAIALDRPTGDVIATIGATLFFGGVSNSLDVVVGAWFGKVTAIDLASWSTQTIEADFDRARAVAFSPSDRLLAIGDENAIVIIDMALLEQIHRIPIGAASGFHWLDEDTILVGGGSPARWITVSLDPSGLAADAAAGLTRTFTIEECGTYAIDPCPTLNEIGGG